MEVGPDQILRLISICLALAGVEMLHGIFRVAVLVPRVGKARAQRIGIVTGTLLAYAVCYVSVPGLGFSRPQHLVVVGIALSLFMALFDISVARFVMKRPWSKVAEDFNPLLGNYLSLGLAALVFAPWAVMGLR